MGPHAGQERLIRYLALDPNAAAPLTEEDKTAAGFTSEDPNSFYRSGKLGDWRKYFNSRHARWFEEEAGVSLILSYYERITQMNEV